MRAVDGVSFDLLPGETLGLVGESGCGKTTMVLDIMEMAKPQAGRIVIDGSDVATLTSAQRHRLRRQVSIVFQDPMAAVDPRLPVNDVITKHHRNASRCANRPEVTTSRPRRPNP